MSPRTKIQLVPPAERYRESFSRGLREFQEEGLPWYVGVDLAAVEQDFAAFVARKLEESTRRTETFVPKTQRWAVAFDSFSIDPAIYKGLKKDVAQHIVGAPASVDDTAEAFTYPSRGQIDTAYAGALKDAKLIDQEFFLDVLDVDLARPIFSGQRCGLTKAISGKTAALDGKLASFAKETDKSKRSALAADIAKGIPALFSEALKGATKPAEAKFLANLTDAKQDVAAHQKEATDFIAACKKRLASDSDKKAATKDLMTYAAHVRSVMRKDVAGFNGQELLEPGPNGDDKMVSDNLGDNPNALDPVTCNLSLQ